MTADSLNARLARYARGRWRALLMRDYARKQGNVNVANRLSQCGSYLLFHDYFTIETLRLVKARFCMKWLLCPLCAMRRASKYLQKYVEKVRPLLESDATLRCYMVTLTVKNGPDLLERFFHLKSAMRKMSLARSHYLRHPIKHSFVEYAKAIGGTYSIEMKRGENSGNWHPHVHMIWLAHDAPDPVKLSQEWLGLTGDSFIVDVRPIHENADRGDGDLVSALLEVFKYALKFSSMSLEDNWQAFFLLSKRRLVGSFGCLRGIQVDEELTDDLSDIASELPYLRILCRYLKAVKGYSVVEEETYVVRPRSQTISDSSKVHSCRR